jgi:hypothetical protein
MKEIINFRPSYLTKGIWLLIIIGGCSSLSIFLILDVEMSYRYLLSMIIIFIGILILFYVNRFEPELLSIDDETIHIDYFNKSLFKRKRTTILLNKITVSSEDAIIKIFNDKTLEAVIRKNAVEVEKWEIINRRLNSFRN